MTKYYCNREAYYEYTVYYDVQADQADMSFGKSTKFN